MSAVQIRYHKRCVRLCWIRWALKGVVVMEFEIVNRMIQQIQTLILDREAGLETRDSVLEALDELLEAAKQLIRKLREV